MVAGGEGTRESGTQNLVFSKDNGRTWSPCTKPNSAINSLIYGLSWNGTKWVAVGDIDWGGPKALLSDNGENWELSSANAFYGRNLLCKGNVCVALTDRNGRIASSSDSGKNWVSANSGNANDLFDNQANAVAANDNGTRWVAGGRYNNTISCSNDGINWIKANTMGLFTEVFDVAYGNNLWVAVGAKDGSGAIAYSSDNGSSWISRDQSSDRLPGTGRVVTYNSYTNMWLASCSGSYNTMLYSLDGKKWTASDSTDGSANSIACNGPRCVAVGGWIDTTIKWSDDGKKWFNGSGDGVFTQGNPYNPVGYKVIS